MRKGRERRENRRKMGREKSLREEREKRRKKGR